MNNFNKRISYILICIASLLFFILDYYFISDWDDIFYKFICTNQTMGYVPQLFDGQHKYVSSFIDVLYSQYNHYFGSNGRFIVHVIVQCFTSFFNTWHFAICNTFIFTLLLYYINKLCNKDFLGLDTIFIIILVTVFCPHTMGAFLGNIAWSVNYLWSATFNIIWLYYYEKLIDKNCISSVERLVIFLFGVFTGSLQESFSIGICAGLGIYHLLKFKYLTFNKIIIIGSYFIGSLFCILSPANFRKANGRLDLLNIDFILDVLQSYTVIVFLLSIFLLLLFSSKKCYNYILNNLVLIISLFFSLFFCLCFVYNGNRQFTISILLSVILINRLLNYFRFRYEKHIKYIVSTIGILLIITYYNSLLNLKKEVACSYYEIVNKSYKDKPRIIYNYNYELACNNVKKSCLSKYFVLNSINGRSDSHYLSIYISDGKDMNYITAVLPVSIKTMVEKCNTSKEVHHLSKLEFNTYACKLKNDICTDSLQWTFKTHFRNPKKFHSMSINSLYKIKVDDDFYYIFENYSPVFETYDIKEL